MKLTIPIRTNGNLLTTVFESDTNSAYDIFWRAVLQTNAPGSLPPAEKLARQHQTTVALLDNVCSAQSDAHRF